jgi:hypothetical protein
MTLENKLIVRYDKEINKHVDIVIKQKIIDFVGITTIDFFEEIEGKLLFVLDDEVGGESSICYGEDKASAYVEICSENIYSIKELLEIIEDVLVYVED